MGIFTDVATTNTEQTRQPVFTAPVQSAVIAPTNSPDQSSRNAVLGAVALQGQQGDPQEPLEQTWTRVNDAIVNGKEGSVRSLIDHNARREMLAASQASQSEWFKANGAPTVSLKAGVAAELQAFNRPENEHALEEEGVAALQDSAVASGQTIRNNDVIGKVRENAQKSAIWQNEFDKLQQEYTNQGLAGKALDLLTLPFSQYYDLFRSGDKGASALLNSPGLNLRQESNSLWSMPLDDFKAYLPTFVEKLKQHSGLLMQNPSVALSAMQSLYGATYTDQATLDAWTGIDTTTIPFFGAAKIARSTVGLLTGIGDSSTAAKAAAAALAKDAGGVPSHAMSSIVMPAEEAVEHALPVYAKASEYVKPFIGNAGGVADHLESLEQSIQEVLKSGPDVERLDPDQVRTAVSNTLATVQNRFRDENIVDFENQGRFTTTPADIAREHEQDVNQLFTEALANAAGKKPSEEALQRFENEGGGLGQRPVAQKAFDDRVELGVDQFTGIHTLSVYLGNKSKPGGYLDAAGATVAAERRGLAGYEIKEGLDGQYYIRVAQHVTENGIDGPAVKGSDLGLAGPVGQWLKSPAGFTPNEWMSDRLQATFYKTHLQKSAVQPLVANLKALSARQTKSVKKIILMGQQDTTVDKAGGKWYNVNELSAHYQNQFNRLPTDKEIKAYYSYKLASDLDYQIGNDYIWTNKINRGWMTGSVKKLGVNEHNVRPINNPNWSDLRVHDADTGKVYGQGAGNDVLGRKFGTGNYKLFELEEPVSINGEQTKYILAHNRDSELSPLSGNQLKYVQGGPREYNSKWFVKQGVSGNFKDGASYETTAITHITSKLRHNAQAWADKMNTAREAWNDFYRGNPTEEELRRWENEGGSLSPTGESGLDRLKKIIEQSPVESFDKWKQLVASGRLRMQAPFEVTYDREMPKSVSGLGSLTNKWVTTDQTAAEAYYTSKGRMHWQEREKLLSDPDSDKDALLVDPFRVLNKTLGHALNTKSFSDYNSKVIDEWSRLVMSGNYLSNKAALSNSTNDIFFHGELSQQLRRSDPVLYQKLSDARTAHKRFLNYQTPAMASGELASRRLAAWLEGKGSFGDWAATKAYNYTSSNPALAMRSFVFDSMLGMFNPGRLLIDTQQALAAASIHPIWGTRAVAMATPILWLMKNRTASLLDHIATSTSLIHGLAPAEFKLMVQSMRASNFMHVGSEVAQNAVYSNYIHGSTVGKAIDTFRTKGRIFFNTATSVNRATAYQIGWQEVKKTMPELEVGGRDFLRNVLRRANIYDGDMTTASRAGWQQGALSIPTQFLQWQSRMLELMMPKMFGGSSALSGTQKARLALGQFLFYGTAGIPLVDTLQPWLSSQYENATGQQLTPEVYNGITKGFFDGALSVMSGGQLDTDFARNAGLGAAWTDLWHKMSDGQLSSAMGIALGPTGSWTGNMLGTMQRVTQYYKAEQTGTLSAGDWKLITNDIIQNISTLNRAQKAYWIWKHGQIVDFKSGAPVADANDLMGYTALLGIPNRVERERFEITSALNSREDDARAYGNLIADARFKAFSAIAEGDDQAAAYFGKLAAGLIANYKDDPLFQQEVYKNAAQVMNSGKLTKWEQVKKKLYVTTGKSPSGGK